MPDKISITQVESTGVDEKIGNRKKSIHEELFKEYNIDVTKKTEPLRPIPMSWVQEIIEFNISSIDIKPSNKNKNTNNRVFTLIFQSNEEALNFEKEFQKNMFSSINNFIESKDQNPKLYNRNVITTTEIDGLQLKISY